NSLLNNYFGIIKKFLPDKPKGTAVGIDIGLNSCKLVEIKKENNEYELVSWATESSRKNGTAEAIKTLIAKLKKPPHTLYTAVFGKGTLIRYIDMPRMALDDMRNSFSIEADKYFPFSQDQIYTDCYILDGDKKSKQMAVMASAAKKEMIDQRTQLISSLGYQAEFIGLNPAALVNALNFSLDKEDEGKDEIVALLDIGESVSTFMIIANKSPRFTRDIFVGGTDFTKRISNTLGISLDEAEKLKCQPEKRVSEVRAACESTLMNIVQELRLSIDYFSTEKSKEVNKLLVTGGGSLLDGIIDVLGDNLEMEVASWNPLKALSVSPEINVDELNKKALQLGVAFGLALYEYD
ncbi:MAG: pilus assembly protein PilM, partial [Candidatus Omnitrophica bacterium]|nr:pilus assembly protein PilM [Candidatus Omnitrophota bacterium]